MYYTPHVVLCLSLNLVASTAKPYFSIRWDRASLEAQQEIEQIIRGVHRMGVQGSVKN